ncbi:penicillin-binding protein 2 [Aquibacillus halophilus]|uniref:serine-type D-Ala-D-Ala carboxypeptidase n=1 Tax=Aquibacillus halophilus TaxID=930132 RepID=A0A6A8DBP0_9BACI|nr:penicillin-binding protein 2 [Aquibacillus halophilus]MRH43113.1 penicillin-binding protein 2 [Aquibacillus halophilus]
MGKKKKKRTQLPFRLNILFLIVFALFSILILQLGVVQILNGEEAQEEIDKTVNTSSKISVPRGKMYDRFGRIILDNEPLRAITYTPPKGGDTADDRLDIAKKLAEFIVIGENTDESNELNEMVKERDKKEYWYLLNKSEVRDRLTPEQLELSNSEQYQEMLEEITTEDLAELDWSDSLLNIIAIKKELDKAYELSPHVIKGEDVTEEEYAKVSEHLYDLPGIDASIDWKRKVVYGSTFRSYIGGITSSNEGIPSENRDFYLTRGYSRNDRVGESGLEQQYESILRGRKEVVQYTTDKSGNIVGSEPVVDGQRGSDLILTIDMELQQAVDQIVQEELQTAVEKHPYQNRYLEDALVAMMNPKTGEVLALSGVRHNKETNEYEDHSFRVIYDAHRPGSAIKGASVLAGLDSGVIYPGEPIYDTCVKIAGTQPKCSWMNLGSINDINALKRSSNVYMFHIAMRMGGGVYRHNDKLRGFDDDGFRLMRNYFSQFGLGVETGIDLPYEGTGFKGDIEFNAAGKLMDFNIGQFDTFTTLQLAQYASTIANDGYRVRPHLLKEVRQPVADKNELGPIAQSVNTEVLNKIEMDDGYIDRVQEGFRRVMQENQGTAVNYFGEAPYNSYKPAGKTGTAENEIYQDGRLVAHVENLSLVGYAPYDDPEIAFAIVVPNNGIIEGGGQHPINHMIGRKILDKYFELKAERAKNGVNLELKQEAVQDKDAETEQE